MNEIQPKEVQLSQSNLQNGLLQPEDIRNTVMVLIAILDGLTGVVLSGDQWSLASGWAKKNCLAAGMTEEEFKKAADKIQAYRIARKRRNPMSCLFDQE
jgi:hypothetical protein